MDSKRGHVRSYVLVIAIVEIIYILCMLSLSIWVYQQREGTGPSEENIGDQSPSGAIASVGGSLSQVPTQFTFTRPVLALTLCSLGTAIGLSSVCLLFYATFRHQSRLLLVCLALQTVVLLGLCVGLVMVTVEGFQLKSDLIDASGGRWNGGPHMFILTMYFVFIDSLIVGILIHIIAVILVIMAYGYVKSVMTTGTS